MFKYAFLLNSETLTPDNYSNVYENPEFYCQVIGTNSMEQCLAQANALAAAGVELIDLCGDFDEEKAQALRKAADEKLEVCYAKYSASEAAKVEAMTEFKEYGILVCADGISDKAEKMELRSDELNTHVVFVADDDMACAEAKKMVTEGIQLIELCSYFTEEKAEAIIKAIDGRIPVGYCG